MRHKNDTAVSPVIAVILMVAITVVLAATVYVFVSQFSDSAQSPARSLGMMAGSATENDNATYTITSATPGLRWNDLKLSLDGTELAHSDLSDGPPSAHRWCVLQPGGPCEATLPTTTISSGTSFVIQHTGTLSGATLTIVDESSNSIIVRVTVR